MILSTPLQLSIIHSLTCIITILDETIVAKQISWKVKLDHWGLQNFLTLFQYVSEFVNSCLRPSWFRSSHLGGDRVISEQPTTSFPSISHASPSFLQKHQIGSHNKKEMLSLSPPIIIQIMAWILPWKLLCSQGWDFSRKCRGQDPKWGKVGESWVLTFPDFIVLSSVTSFLQAKISVHLQSYFSLPLLFLSLPLPLMFVPLKGDPDHLLLLIDDYKSKINPPCPLISISLC